jgi:signal transduction histidine kinase
MSRGNGSKRVLPVPFLIAAIVLAVLGVVLAVVAWPHLKPVDAYPLLWLPVAAVVYAALGTLIVLRVRNPIGWLLIGEGAGLALICDTSAYAVIGVAHPGLWPIPKVVGASSEWLFVPVVMGLAFMFLIFPTGGLPSLRWRPVAIAVAVAIAITLVAFIVTPRQIALPAPGGVSLRFPNPFGIPGLRNDVLGTISGLGIVSALAFVAAAAALVVRYRSGVPELRQQIKWVAFAAGAEVALQVALTIALVTEGNDAPVTTVIGLASALLALIGIPVAITIAILKHGLYQIDVIINRTVVYGLLAAAVTGVYIVIVAGIGALAGYGGGPVLTIGAAVVIAVLFQPLRRRAQRVANRVVYGERATPYQVLSEFADAMARTLPLEEQLDRMVSLLASGTGATGVEVWIRIGSTLRAAVIWPHSASRPSPRTVARDDDLSGFADVTAAFPVRQDDETLGVVALYKPKNEPLSPAETALAQHVASQAALVVRNVRLDAELRNTIDELRASRRRLVEAQDSERRKIERNLHDGAQQQLVALGVQLGLLERFARDVPGAENVTGAIPGLQQMLHDALDDLRDLARGIYPPLLADRGLAAALEAQARKASVPTTVEADGIGRYDQQVEATVYFCALEALQNVAKYAGATSAVVRLAEADGWLTFQIRDDGRGFELGTATGSGLQGMADRLDAIGGTLEVDSGPGTGTVIRGLIPPAG